MKDFSAYYYADDLSILLEGKKNLKKAIDIITLWSKQNDVIINLKKCGILILNEKRAGLSKYETSQ